MSTTIAEDAPVASPRYLRAAAGLNVALFHLGVYRRVEAWGDDRRPPPAARAAGAVSLVVWTGVVACGRLIAYT
ncbi:hypothetical protein [Nonomuraea dietziae]|uniref:hypothetical protein n=1 Tax=Nonomuraea dietziae TaxID=65515 RepID=UPI0033CEC14C